VEQSVMEILSLPTIQTIRRQHMWKPANLNRFEREIIFELKLYLNCIRS